MRWPKVMDESPGPPAQPRRDRIIAVFDRWVAPGWPNRRSPIKGNVKRHFSPSARCRHFFVSAFSPTVCTCTRDRVVLLRRRSFVLRVVTRNDEILLPPCGSISLLRRRHSFLKH